MVYHIIYPIVTVIKSIVSLIFSDEKAHLFISLFVIQLPFICKGYIHVYISEPSLL